MIRGHLIYLFKSYVKDFSKFIVSKFKQFFNYLSDRLSAIVEGHKLDKEMRERVKQAEWMYYKDIEGLDFKEMEEE
tara:strand:+ start:1454 stop:1681 length:228 start_codon:yes stop_codon:yes gene_type:complete